MTIAVNSTWYAVHVSTTVRFSSCNNKGPPNGAAVFLAKKQLMAMQVGERGFFYHSNEGKAVVGIVAVIRAYYPDHTDETGRFGMVDVKAVRAMPSPVTLEAIKADPALADMVLVNNSRLSVQPVTEAEWARVCALGGLG